MVPESPVHLELELAEVNTILNALGDQAYREVFELIEKIRGQAGTQLGAAADDGYTEEQP